MKNAVLNGMFLLSALSIGFNTWVKQIGNLSSEIQFEGIAHECRIGGSKYLSHAHRKVQNTCVKEEVQKAEQVKLGVPYISQGNTMVCEAASLLQVLKYLGKTNAGLYDFVEGMPRAGDENPYHGFSGEWRFNVEGTYQGMMLDPLEAWAKNQGCTTSRVSGVEGVRDSLRNGSPVIVWIVYQFKEPEYRDFPWGRAVWNGHVVCVDGFTGDTFHIVDPALGKYDVSSEALERSLNVMHMALGVGR